MTNTETTTDYDSFKILGFNRDLNETSVKKLQQSIRDHGFLLPILVNNEMYVLDGQHRLEAARREKVPVPFIKYDLPTNQIPILISTLNSLSVNWGLYNYFHLWHEQEREAYLDLALIKDTYGFSVTNVLRLAGITGTSGINAFKVGKMTFTDAQKERFEMRCKKVNELSNYSEAWADFNRTVKFISALCKVVLHPQYDHTRMLEQLTDQVMKIQRATSGNEFLLTFTDIYNHKRRGGRISFVDRFKGKARPKQRDSDYEGDGEYEGD